MFADSKSRFGAQRLAGVWFGVTATVLSAACATKPGLISVTKPVPGIYAPRGLAVHGYDSVAYFSEQRPIEGSAAFVQRWHGAEWRFASREHQVAFAANPEHYAPQYGGYCAFAVSRGTTADGDPQQWAIVRDRLYLNNNAFAKALWDSDRDGSIVAGDINWPLLPKLPLPP